MAVAISALTARLSDRAKTLKPLSPQEKDFYPALLLPWGDSLR